MKIINRPRGTGKTTQLIYLSEVSRIPIVSRNPNYIIDMAKKLGCDIPAPVSIEKFIQSLSGRGYTYGTPKYFIDDLENILPNVEVVTVSISK